MNIQKSSRHSKITGDFAESRGFYLLLKDGFECARVDHTGIDIIARNPNTNELMGISVKSRCRNKGRDEESLSISSDNFTKLKAACEAFDCNPYFAFVVDAENLLRVFIVSMPKLLTIFPPTDWASYWKMSKTFLESYEMDPEIIMFELKSQIIHWW
jgi:hypothetical protein